MWVLNLGSEYWHVPFHPHFNKFLTIRVEDVTLQFVVVSFALNITLRIFTKLTRDKSSSRNQLGIVILMYVNNWLITMASPQ